MGCASSTATTSATHNNTYPKQSNLPNRNNLYNDNDPTDDLPPEVTKPGSHPKKQKQQQKPATKPTTSDEADTPEPPPSEPKPVEKENEDKVLVNPIVKPPSDEDDILPHVEPKGDVTERTDKNNYTHMGRKTKILDTRPGAEQKKATERPKVTDGQLWVDEDFGVETAFEGQVKVDWKRPGEFAKNPSLFCDGSIRFDVGQGTAGTCWFLSIVASLADKEDIIKQVIPDDSYRIGTSSYDGIFHCRFWKFGEWIDVYVDDFLPVLVNSNSLWGAHSVTDKNEMWVPLIEKAFAKFQGSYFKAEGGWSGDAFISLTGGIVEQLKLESLNAKDLYTRVTNALACGSVITCSVPPEKDGKKGLVGGHAYTLTGATLVKPSDCKKTVALFRVRNPWGKENGEWTGDYSDKSSKWNLIDKEVKDKLNMKKKGDGEFWMTLTAFYTYFKSTNVCNFTPDFDEDGKEDNLDHVSCAFGQWEGPTAAGKEMEAKMNNQRFIFSVPKKGLESDGKLPVVLQFFQHREGRKGSTMFYIRADLYKIEQQFKKQTVCLALDEMTNFTTYFGGFNVCYRYRLEHGDYMVVPTTMEPGQEKDFLIRLFSSLPLPLKELQESASVFIRRFETVNEFSGIQIKTEKLQHVYGRWKSGFNAGGQISHKTFCSNPQYIFEIKGQASGVPLMVSLKQEISANKLPIGFKIYQVPKMIKSPLDIKYLWKNHKTGTVESMAGDQVFIMAFEASGVFNLVPGCYALIAFLKEPDYDKQYVLTIGTDDKTNVSLKGLNTAE